VVSQLHGISGWAAAAGACPGSGAQRPRKPNFPDVRLRYLTDNGIQELRDMLADARRSPEHWRNFLDNFVADPDVIARVNEKEPR